MRDLRTTDLPPGNRGKCRVGAEGDLNAVRWTLLAMIFHGLNPDSEFTMVSLLALLSASG